MSIDGKRAEIARLLAKGAALTAAAAKYRQAASTATATANKKQVDAAKAKTDSTRRTALNAAEREERKAATALKSLSSVEKSLAANNKSLASKQASLSTAEKAVQRVEDREATSRRQAELRHAREMARAAAPVIRFVEVRPPDPEPLRVLYATSNPEAVETTVVHADGSEVTDGVWLRVERERRAVARKLKGSKYRDLVDILPLYAATSADLLEAMNDHRPHVIHFSGHAAAWGLLMESEDGTDDGEELGYSLLARLLGATDTPPRMVVLNACHSLTGADDLLRTVPVVIGMSDSFDDSTAIVFAASFYSAVASAQSVATALEQGRVAVEIASLAGSDLPTVRARDGVDLQTLVLVRPPI